MHDGAAAPAADHASHAAVDHSAYHHDTSHHHYHPSQHDVLVEIDSHRREHEHPHHPHHQTDPPPYTEDPTNPLYQPIYTHPHYNQGAFYGTMQRTSERCRCQTCMADVRALEAGHSSGQPRNPVPGICEAMVKFIFFMIWMALIIFIVSAALRTWRGCENFPNRAGCHW